MSSNIRINKVCEQCGNVFEARKLTTRTCSDSCAKKACKARERAIGNNQRALRIKKLDRTIEYQALLAKWHFLWAYGEILRKLCADDIDAIYKKIVSGKVFENKDHDFIDRWFNRVFNKITEIIETNYKAGRVTISEDDLPAFNLKNWLREKNAFEDFKDNFKRLLKEDYLIRLGQ